MHIHFMGIGGCGVSGLALMAKDQGYSVSGCDVSVSPYFKMVESKGVQCYIGHSEQHLAQVDLLVKSSAVPDHDPEVQMALSRGIVVYNRGTFLAHLLKNDFVIGVAGSHGKTTTSWMIFHILKLAGLQPSIYAGGKSDGITNINASKPVIVELDESDGTVFEIDPEILLINNLEFEHADYFKSESNMRMLFERYLMKRDKRRLVVGRGFEPGSSLCTLFDAISFPSFPEIEEKKGYENTSEHTFTHIDGSWYMIFNGNEYFVGDGKDAPHVLQNRFAALSAASLYLSGAGIEIPSFDWKFWKTMPGIDRRFQIIGAYKNVVMIDDYAHHPTEISATVKKAEIDYKNFGLIFQPHRSSRLNTFYEKFKESLEIAGPLIILPVFKAGEEESGHSSLDLYNDLKNDGRFSELFYFHSVKEAGQFLKDNIEKLRVSALVCVGAGDLNNIFSCFELEKVDEA